MDIENINLRSLRHNMSLVMQEPFLFSKTIKENIAITDRDTDMEKVEYAAKIACIHDSILSFKDECCVYPAADGKVSEVSQNADGTYTLKISHSDSFTGVIGGLNNVYYTVGETVKCNVPVGYSKGETEVQVTMYSGGVLLNCFQITEENCLAWLEE